MMSEGNDILIAGLGNLLLRDDGVGVHALRLLQSEDLPRCQSVEVGTQILGSLHLLEEYSDVIAIDAVAAGTAPGTVYRLMGDDLEREEGPVSLHQIGLSGALPFLPAERRPRIHVVGVEPAIIDYGMELSPEVRGSLPLVCEEVKRLVSDIHSKRSVPC